MSKSIASRDTILRVMKLLSGTHCSCPAHSQAFSHNHGLRFESAPASDGHYNKEYAFEMASSSIRFGPGVTQEVGMDFKNMGAKNVCVVTDKKLSELPPFSQALDSLCNHGVKHDVFDNVRIEPTDASMAASVAEREAAFMAFNAEFERNGFMEAIEFAKKGQFDTFLAVGGGSAMDTAKAANLYSSCPENDFLDFVNAPIGKGLPVTKTLKPLIAIPTTAGTGSETTGVAVFDYEPLKAKTGIADRAIRPLLGIVDPLHTRYMPERVAANSGFDVLCHALESYTAIPFAERTPRPSNPNLRPAYQGSNPISDIWSLQALRTINKYMKRAVTDPEDFEARSEMHLASVFAGIGFGNAGVHLCHGMSYAISGLVKSYKAQDYATDYPIVPHGLSVVLSAPAVFSFTSSACPERHLEAAKALGVDITGVRKDDVGKVLSDFLRQFMYDLNVDDGLAAVGYSTSDIPDLVRGTVPQHRVTKLAPAGAPGEEELAKLFESSLRIY